MSNSIKDSLQETLAYVKSEVRLLENIFWWYIFPFSTGLILFFAGFGVNLKFFVLTGVVIILSVLVKHINTKSLNKDYYPLIRDIEQGLKNLDE